mmetsp:Transcript_18527/g.42606  ORF Transcript_18527/g.42606 Transcript_18527/m.42606 type:complete len:409 (+) Transcript_18527:96-1322(+)
MGDVDDAVDSIPNIADDGRKNNWSVWRVVDKLEERKDDFYPGITVQVLEILRSWGRKWQGNQKMASLLNKSSLYHEMEETIVTMHYLYEGLARREEKICHVIDVCAGKGMLSFLLSYLKHPKVSSIVMLEKATIDWSHIEESNKTAREENRPEISIWDNTNLHDYDDVLDRMVALPHPIALCGIHLCKQLGPSFCGLFNGLGEKSIYGCLSPCCMPRAVTTQKRNAKKRKTFTLSIQLAETKQDRRARRDYMLRRERFRKKPDTGPCFHCNAEDHSLMKCTVLKTLPADEQISIRRAWHIATIPCWNCMEIGHYKSECPNVSEDGVATGTSSSHKSRQPPATILDVTDVLKTTNPYATYCQILSSAFRQEHVSQSNRVRVIETSLKKDAIHDEANWNDRRKSIFIVVD